MSDIKTITVNLPIALHRRAVKARDRLKKNVNQQIRDALAAFLDEEDAKFLAEEKRRAEEKLARRAISGRVLGRLGESPLGPRRRDSTVDEAPPFDPLEETYRRHATLIAAVVASATTDPREKRLRVAEAVAEIKRLAPLTHPPDAAIVSELERRVIELRGVTPATVAIAPAPPPATNSTFDAAMRFVDELTGMTVPAKVRTYGYVPGSDDHRGDEE